MSLLPNKEHNKRANRASPLLHPDSRKPSRPSIPRKPKAHRRRATKASPTKEHIPSRDAHAQDPRNPAKLLPTEESLAHLTTAELLITLEQHPLSVEFAEAFLGLPVASDEQEDRARVVLTMD